MSEKTVPKQRSNIREILLLWVVCIIVLAIAFGVYYLIDKNKKPSTIPTTTSVNIETPEYKLASINAGVLVSRDDPNIAWFKTILDRLDRECPESRSLISDMIVFTWNNYKKETGKTPSLKFIAQELNKSLPDGMSGVMKFAEIAAGWLTLAIQR